MQWCIEIQTRWQRYYRFVRGHTYTHPIVIAHGAQKTQKGLNRNRLFQGKDGLKSTTRLRPSMLPTYGWVADPALQVSRQPDYPTICRWVWSADLRQVNSQQEGVGTRRSCKHTRIHDKDKRTRQRRGTRREKIAQRETIQRPWQICSYWCYNADVDFKK